MHEKPVKLDDISDLSLSITVKLHIMSFPSNKATLPCTTSTRHMCAWEQTDLQALNHYDGFIHGLSFVGVQLFEPTISLLPDNLAFREHCVHLAVQAFRDCNTSVLGCNRIKHVICAIVHVTQLYIHNMYMYLQRKVKYRVNL